MLEHTTTILVYTGEHYSLFVVRHIGRAQIDTLVSTRSTVDTSNVSSRVET